MDDRSAAFHERNVRYQLKKFLGELGSQPTVQQINFIQSCIEEAKQQYKRDTLSIIQHVHTRFESKDN